MSVGELLHYPAELVVQIQQGLHRAAVRDVNSEVQQLVQVFLRALHGSQTHRFLHCDAKICWFGSIDVWQLTVFVQGLVDVVELQRVLQQLRRTHQVAQPPARRPKTRHVDPPTRLLFDSLQQFRRPFGGLFVAVDRQRCDAVQVGRFGDRVVDWKVGALAASVQDARSRRCVLRVRRRVPLLVVLLQAVGGSSAVPFSLLEIAPLPTRDFSLPRTVVHFGASVVRFLFHF